jgi:hypothetical protein
MDRSTIIIMGVLGSLAAIAVVTGEMGPTEHRELFAAVGPVTAPLLRERLESDGYSTVQITEDHDQGVLIATALKEGKKSRFVISAKDGRDESLWYDDDD